MEPVKKRMYLLIARFDKDDWPNCMARMRDQGVGWTALVNDLGEAMTAFTELDGSIASWVLHTERNAPSIMEAMRGEAPYGRGTLIRTHDKIAVFELTGESSLRGFSTMENFISRRAPTAR